MGLDAPQSIRLLTVCGSLQSRSANRAALAVAAASAGDAGAAVDDFDRLADIPPFNVDHVDEAIPVVADWRRRVARADALLVAAPEYAGAVAGAVKNAFDWLVGSGELYRKPVAVISAGTSGGLHAQRMMAQTLTWQGAYVVATLGIASPRTKLDDQGRFDHEPTAAAIASVTATLLAAIAASPIERVEQAGAIVGALGIDAGHVVPAA
jgi:chromate reductase, NAD(P)H dehydrogenase (quinone)